MSDPATTEPIPPAEELPVIEQWPAKSPSEAAGVLARVGLGDPFTWAKLPATLSVGQRQRLSLALALTSPANVLCVDEWLSGLDAITARAVAYTTGRTLRRLGMGAVLVTARDDMATDLAPDLHIRVGWNADPRLEWTTQSHGACTILDELKFRRGSTKDWSRLKDLHYIAGDPATVHSVYVAEHPALQDPAAVAVLSWPDLHSAARNLATQDAYVVRHDRTATTRLNREVVKLSRIVVTPELRGVGVARALLTHVVGQTHARYVECVTALGRFTGFLEAIGFTEVVQTPSQAEAALLDWYAREQVPPALTLDPAALAAWVDSLSVRKRREARRLVWRTFHQLVLWKRTRRDAPRLIAHHTDPRWPEAWKVAAARVHDRPSYWIIGPIDRMTGQPEEPAATANHPVRLVS